jgi:hypothetical protein
MGWNKWPYWLRGGLIGLLTAFILIVFGVLFSRFFGSYPVILEKMFEIIYYPSSYVFKKSVNQCANIGATIGNPSLGCVDPSWIWVVLTYVCFVAEPFIIGAIIGWIYGKVKNRK